MEKLESARHGLLRALLGRERPCDLAAEHVLATGNGVVWVDRAAAPRVAFAMTGGNAVLRGAPSAISDKSLRDLVDDCLEAWDTLFVSVPPTFVERFDQALSQPARWPRVEHVLPDAERVADLPPPPGHVVRRLAPRDLGAVERLDAELAWISDTRDGPRGLVAAGDAFGAFEGDRLLSVAAIFYRGDRYEELGVVTQADARGRGLSSACARAASTDIRQRGRTPCWATTPDNVASLRVAAKLGFVRTREVEQRALGEWVPGMRRPAGEGG